MTDQALERVEPRVVERSRVPRPSLRGDWWRHIVVLIGCAVALFPVAYVASAAFNADQSLGGASLIPRDVTLENFREILSPDPAKSQLQSSTSNYVRWLGNSLGIALLVALLNVLLGALAAYAFSRFRFRGRRIGLLFLLLVQMFPQLLALVAIYLILLRTGAVFPFMGLDTKTGLILVYQAGLQNKQAFLFRLVDVANELFAMAATVSRAQALAEARRPEAKEAGALADVFCRMGRRMGIPSERSPIHDRRPRRY